MSPELAQALASLNLHRNAEVFWLSYDAEISDEVLGLDEKLQELLAAEQEVVLDELVPA